MSTLSIRLPDHLKKEISQVAKKQGVSMNNFIVCSVSAAVSQQFALDFFKKELHGVNRVGLKDKFQRIINKTQKNDNPSMDKINQLITDNG